MTDDFVGNGGFQHHPLNRAVNLHRNGLLPDVFLRARRNAFGATQIVVAFLRLGGDKAAAFAAPEKAAIQIWFQLRSLGLAFLRHDFLHPVEQALGNDWLVLALVQFAIECHDAVEKGILERPLEIRNRHALVHAGRKAKLFHPSADFMEGIIAGRVKFEGFADERGLFRLDGNAPIVAVVEISDGWAIGPDAVPQFLPDATLDIFREVINIVFALAEGDVEHEFAMRRCFKAKCGKAQILNFADVHQVHDPAAVNAVAGKAVGVPCKDAVGVAFLDLAQHEIELRASRRFGRATLIKGADNIQSFALGHFLKLKKLRLDGQDLAVTFVRGFADINEEIVG